VTNVTGTTALGLVLVLAGAAVGQPPADQTPARQPAAPAALAMEDQFGESHSVAAHRGDVLVLIYGDRQSADANRAVGEQLHVHFHPSARGLPPDQARQAPVRPVPGSPRGARTPDVLAVPVACVGQVPALVRAWVRLQVRTGSPDVPVWLDFQDQMRQQFGLGAGMPNLVVFDATGRPRFTASGPLNAERFLQLTKAIEGLRRETTQQAAHR
jgi:hypothetical protein